MEHATATLAWRPARRACLQAALARAALSGAFVFLFSCVLFASPPGRALREALMFAVMLACIHAPWLRSHRPRWAGSWQGWVLGFVAVIVVGVIWRLLDLSRN